MNKFYIDENRGRQYYAYKYQNNEINYITLNKEDIRVLLSSLSKSQISQIKDRDKSMEIIFNNGLTLIVDNLQVFQPHHDNYDNYFQLLLMKLKQFIEKETIKKYKKNLPINYTPKVNRKRKNNLPTKQIIAGAMSFVIGTSLISGLINKEIKKANEETISISTNYEMPKKELQKEIEQDLAVVIPDSIVALAFEDRTESNRVDDETSKLEETNQYFGSYIEKYSIRYGLPYDIVSAQITQERPNIENGVCENICQITYDYFVGQTMVVPIYNEQGFTGEYDTFLVTKEMLDTPEGNIRVGVAYLRTCVDRFNSLILGLFSYNQGESTLGIACNYYGLDKENYSGDENAIKARDLINRYYEEQNKSHGDANYLEHVFSYLELSDRGSKVLEYYLGSEKKAIEINNTLMYNNSLSR